MTVTYHPNVDQGSDEWLALRCGLLTASEMKLIITPGTLKPASNDKERSHLYELLAQRITKHVEPAYVSDDMLRGQVEEIEARSLYEKHYAPVETVGFITNDKWGFTIGFSPDGLVGDEGIIETKSRRQKYQIETIVDHVRLKIVPPEHVIQVQTGLLVSERQWCDFNSYSDGMPMATIRVEADPAMQAAIVDAARAFEARLEAKLVLFADALTSAARLIPTQRKQIMQDIKL